MKKIEKQLESNDRKNEKNIYGKTRTKSLKSELNLDQFKYKINAVDMDITKFSEYFGISRPTIYGWSTHGIPIYVERILELLEIKKRLHIGIDELYNTNTDTINKLHEINTKEPTKSKKLHFKNGMTPN